MSKGLIYVLINPVQDGYLKIGKTTRTSQERADELNRQGKTALAGRHIVAYDEEVDNCDLVEYLVHEKLKKYRTHTDREFFHIPVRQVIQEIRIVLQEMSNQQNISEISLDKPKATSPFVWWGNLTQIWQQIFKSHVRLDYEPTESELIEGVTNIVYYSRNVELRMIIAKLIEDKDYQKKIGSWYLKLSSQTQKMVKTYLSRKISETELQAIINLKEVNCNDSLFINDLCPIMYLPNIEILNCRNTAIKNVEILKNILTLQEININFTDVETLEPLIDLPNLKMLSCYKSKVSEDEIKRFAERKPSCEIEESYLLDLPSLSKSKRTK